MIPETVDPTQAPASTVPIEAPPEAEVDDATLISVKLEAIDPVEAARLLTTNAGSNRPTRRSKVSQLAETMRNQQWRLTGEALKLDRDGNLIDGQHRLKAVIEADMTITFHVFTGLARDVYRHLDTGAIRTYTDVLKIDQETHPSALASAAAWVHRYLNSFSGSARISHEMGDRVLEEHPRLREFADYSTKRLVQRGLGVAFHYLCALRDEDRAARFFKELADGTARQDTPVYTLRERLIREKMSGKKHTLTQLVIAGFIIKTWNADVTGQPLPTLKYVKGETIPNLLPAPAGGVPAREDLLLN
jgi:hypothetical protein